MPASKLTIYRRKNGLTQEKLAELSGITTRTIQRIEKGAVVPHIHTLKILADCLEIDIEMLTGDHETVVVEEEVPVKKSIVPLFHLLALLGLALPILNIILPFILWLLKRDENEEFDRQGKQVLNFHLSMTLLFFPSIIVMVYFFPIGFTLTIAVYLFMVMMTLINLFRAVKLQTVAYPLSFPFLKI